MNAKTSNLDSKAAFENLADAADYLFFSCDKARRVVAQRKDGKTFNVCSRAKARRLGLKIVARNY